MKRVNLATEPRSATGTGPNRRLRIEGKVPAVVYGGNGETEKLSIDGRTFGRYVAGKSAGNVIFSLGTADGTSDDSKLAVAREIQRDPLSRRILHVDFFRVRMDVEAEFELPLRLNGVPIGVREGGILETHLYTLAVRCLPGKLPNHLDLDVTSVKILTSLHASDVPLPEGITLVTEGEETVLTVLPPKTEVVATPTAEAVQPEVITKKKAEDAK